MIFRPFKTGRAPARRQEPQKTSARNACNEKRRRGDAPGGIAPMRATAVKPSRLFFPQFRGAARGGFDRGDDRVVELGGGEALEAGQRRAAGAGDARAQGGRIVAGVALQLGGAVKRL